MWPAGVIDDAVLVRFSGQRFEHRGVGQRRLGDEPPGSVLPHGDQPLRVVGVEEVEQEHRPLVVADVGDAANVTGRNLVGADRGGGHAAFQCAVDGVVPQRQRACRIGRLDEHHHVEPGGRH